MNHATTYRIGNSKNTRRKKGATVEPTASGICTLDGAHKRCAGNQERQKAIRTDSHASNGFLKTSFLPKLKMEQSLQTHQQTSKLEREFYISLSRLAKHYGIELLETGQFSNPYNIALSIWDAKTKLQNNVYNLENLQLAQEKNKTFLMTQECCNTGLTLYYIPALPLFAMLKDKRRRKTALLLLSVCSYLYHVADIPYYRQEGSYLFWQYEMMGDWLEQDEEEIDHPNYKDELKQAEWIGEQMEQKMFNRKNLAVFEHRLNHLKESDEFDTECLKMAKEAFSLYTLYPAESIFRNAKQMNAEDEDYDEQECVPMEKYISFWADSSGWLSESISECINNEFNEYSELDQPTIFKRFDGSPLTDKNLNFENRLFDLLDELIYLLNTYKKQKK
ncbi:hypothetical protein J7E50_18205 [Pedobacter sp. ISL-68]|uniref:hypothetical protein n=1 Tax=unclassified Pedobacter TaxID=2628915 RepID=UPI001BE520E3|nr:MULTISPECIES: hypothetical protein [unclassified Pedobacter]MBT2559856.1 hypothetical protein [Pedobacter sp. ISL-64]MBT2592161.1 hypothetical protein [Pedobacter sp. ISL-68]